MAVPFDQTGESSPLHAAATDPPVYLLRPNAQRVRSKMLPTASHFGDSAICIVQRRPTPCRSKIAIFHPGHGVANWHWELTDSKPLARGLELIRCFARVLKDGVAAVLAVAVNVGHTDNVNSATHPHPLDRRVFTFPAVIAACRKSSTKSSGRTS
jgi:hypothetical protein